MRRRLQRGATLVFTIAVLAGLVSLLAAFAASQRATTRNLQMELDRRQARIAAMAGIERAMASLATVDPNTVAATDDWGQIGEVAGQYFEVGAGTVRMEIMDEGSFVNLNTADQQQLLNMGLTTEQADSLMDWREAGQEARPEGAKDQYYNALPTPYNAALRPLRSFDELLLIKGFVARDLYELPEERNASQVLTTGNAEDQPVLMNLVGVWSSSPFTGQGGQARLNVNTANQQQLQQIGIQQPLAQAIIQRRNTQGTFTTLGQVLTTPGVTLQNATQILNSLSVNGATTVTGRLNLNTATEAALNSIPNMTPDMSTAIVTRQQTGFTGLGDLTSVPGVTLQFLQENADRFTVGSSVFRIRVIGRYAQTSVPLEAIVTIQNNAPKLTAILEQPYADMDTRWLWTTEPSTPILLAEDE